MTTHEARCPLCGWLHPVLFGLFDVPVIVCPALAGRAEWTVYQGAA